jgi:hypothetical protein
VSDHGHPSARQRHEDAAFERACSRAPSGDVAELARREQRVRDVERLRIAGVLVQDTVETDFQGCVG